MIELANRIRSVAEHHLGSGHKSIDRSHRAALDGIASGEGLAAIQAMIGEFEKTTSLVGGLGVTEQFKAEITELTLSS